jgi:hypothetical protein
LKAGGLSDDFTGSFADSFVGFTTGSLRPLSEYLQAISQAVFAAGSFMFSFAIRFVDSFTGKKICIQFCGQF